MSESSYLGMIYKKLYGFAVLGNCFAFLFLRLTTSVGTNGFETECHRWTWKSKSAARWTNTWLLLVSSWHLLLIRKTQNITLFLNSVF